MNKATALLLDLMNLGPLELCDVIRTADGHYLGRKAGEPGYNVHIGEPKAAPGPGQDRSRQLWESWTQAQRDAVTFRAAAPLEGQPIPLEAFGIEPEPLLQDPAKDAGFSDRYDVQVSVDLIEVDSAGDYVPDSVKSLYFEPLRRCGNAVEADELVDLIIENFKVTSRGSYDTRENSAPARPKEADPVTPPDADTAEKLAALDTIYALMFGIEWHDERFRKIGEALEAAGYTFDCETDPAKPYRSGGQTFSGKGEE